MIKTLYLSVSVLSFVASAHYAVAQDFPPIAKVAHVGDDVFDHTIYRSVALKSPWLYALDRAGNLHIYRIPRNAMADFAAGFCRVFTAILGTPLKGPAERTSQQLQLLKTINNVGDGNDLEIFDDVLVLTSKGKLAFFDLVEPSDPTRIGEFGPESAAGSRSIVRCGDYAFVLGSGYIASFDISNPSTPKYLATLKNDNGNWNGCYDGQFLYVSETPRTPKNRTGIAVYDITNPMAISERHFVQTETAAYHVFVNHDGYLWACLDSKSRFHIVWSGAITVAGSTQVFELDEDNAPKSVATAGSSGGRSVVVTQYRDTTIMICNGLVFSVKNQTLQEIYSFFPAGSTLDGYPYHGDHHGRYAALPTDRDISVFEIGAPPLYVLGRHFALALIRLVAP